MSYATYALLSRLLEIEDLHALRDYLSTVLFAPLTVTHRI